MTAAVALIADEPARHRGWAPIELRAPQLAETAWASLDQMGLSLRPASIDAADRALRVLAEFLVGRGTLRFADVDRGDIEAFKTALTVTPTAKGTVPSRNTIRLRLGIVRSFFDRIIEWSWADAPARTPMFAIDVPIADDPLPRFLDDAQAARLMAAATHASPLDRLVVELLARTGMRASEVCDLAADAVEILSGAHWLRVPLGKLRNDRYVPLHPKLVELLTAWPAGRVFLIEVDGRPINRRRVGRIVNRVAKAAGLEGVHPHRLRHTLATQAINRGMRLEAIAALLGHRSLRMTMTYARIANTTVADEYATAQASVDALYDETDESDELRQLRLEHRRMLGNGYCARPRGTDCSFEAVCEGCGYYETSAEFAPTLRAQRDHAADHAQPVRVELYNRLLERIETTG
jgi:integrase